MNHVCHNNIIKAVKIGEALMDTANMGDAASTDDSCRILFGVIRECAYKILKQAEYQRLAHDRSSIRERKIG
jgi:hypothetical protein